MTSESTSSAVRPSPSGRSAFRFWTEEKLRNADTDQFRHVNNAVVSTFLEAARMEILAAELPRSLSGGANLAVVRLLLNFHRELHFPGRVQIGSTVVSVGTTSISVRQGVFDGDAEWCSASAEATCVLLNPGTGRPHPVPEALRAYLLRDADADSEGAMR